MEENVDYELVPSEETDDWRVRILKGDYTETVFQFTVLKLDPDDVTLHFDYVIIYSPISDLEENNEGLLNVVGSILYDMLDQYVKKSEGE